jgi:hypothetical protein
MVSETVLIASLASAAIGFLIFFQTSLLHYISTARHSQVVFSIIVQSFREPKCKLEKFLS